MGLSLQIRQPYHGMIQPRFVSLCSEHCPNPCWSNVVRRILQKVSMYYGCSLFSSGCSTWYLLIYQIPAKTPCWQTAGKCKGEPLWVGEFGLYFTRGKKSKKCSLSSTSLWQRFSTENAASIDLSQLSFSISAPFYSTALLPLPLKFADLHSIFQVFHFLMMMSTQRDQTTNQS